MIRVTILDHTQRHDLLIALPDGTVRRCDPWAGCAMPYDPDQQLTGRTALLNPTCLVSTLDTCFLPNEGEFVLLEADARREVV